MTKLLIHGFFGAMGQNVYQILKDNLDYQISGFDVGMSNQSNIIVYNDLSNIAEQFDVIIDFSHHSQIDSLLEYASGSDTPLVLCTTGLSKETINKVNEYKKNIPVFQSGNMSLGVNILIELAKIGARALQDFDIEIIEKHHNKKIDAPSGTAYMIADGIKDERNNLIYNFGRQGNNAKREKNEIGIHAVRGGTITGEHTVLFAGIDEIVEIKHQANSKAVFAKGAIEAANFIINKKNGLYNMSDLILGGN